MRAGNDKGAALAAPTRPERAAAPISKFEAAAQMLDASISKFEERASDLPIAKSGGDATVGRCDSTVFQNGAEVVVSCHEGYCRAPVPENQSVPGPVDGFKAFTPSSEPLRKNVSHIRAIKGPEIGQGCLTPFFEDLGSTLVRQHRGIDMHNDLREIARAQSSLSRREIDDTSEVERLAEKETPASPETNVYKRGRPAAGVSWPSNNTREMTACEDASIANMPAVDHSSADENILHNAHSEQPTPQTNMREV